MTNLEIHTSSFEADLNAPADGVPVHQPVTTRPQVLPFGDLTWENFERLCYRVVGQGRRVEHIARYGRSGQPQQGIDLFVRLSNGKYEVWQAKRYASITAGEIKTIIDTFRAGTWVAKTEQLVLAVQASLADTKIQDAIEREAAALKEVGITLVPRGGEELSDILRDYPGLVDDFFGRAWVEAFLGSEVAHNLGARLDGAEFARIRTQLRKFYDAQFHLLDVGLALPPVMGVTTDARPSLLERFTMPDVFVRDTIFDEQRTPNVDQSGTSVAESPGSSTADDDGKRGPVRRREYVRRMPLAPWLSTAQQLSVVGEAGSGKSMLLRCIALDVLIERGTFPEISRRWGGFLPIHISFSRWSRLSSTLGRAAGLKEIVAEVLQPTLTGDLISLLDRAIDGRRVLLLLDGLDEWSNEQAARTTLQYILAFTATHEVPTIATARPRGLDKIGAIPKTWSIGEVAPLSVDQQRMLARVWFVNSTARAATEEPSSEARAPIEARLDRFFAELGRDRRLPSLAGNPLLLVGLVALSLRQIALPRNRTQTIASLIGILVEIHPEQRATEAGDTQPRFLNIPDADDRRAALARLAFVARAESGGGTYDLKEARKVIRDYLADPATFAYSQDRAQRAAEELLAVNSETIGLLAERSPGEIGFAHAVFEEFLAGEHIRSWSFSEIVRFVRTKSGQPLWRNAISSLISLLNRPSEVEDLVATIEAARAADTSREGIVSRDVLLADIAFSSSRKPQTTASRLIDAAFETIERGDWMLARREVLRSALTNIGDLAVTTPVDDRILRWAPRRQKYLGNLFDALASWAPTPELQAALCGGLYDEERSTQHRAAHALSRIYAGHIEIQQWLQAVLRTTLDLSVAAAALEALTVGWPATPNLFELHDRAVGSLDPTLRLIGIFGRTTSGRANLSDRDALVELLADFSKLDFWDRPTARALLSQYWPDDPKIIELSLKALGRGGSPRGEFEREAATRYLLGCSPLNPTVANWVRQELKEKYPFSPSMDNCWDCILPFAIEHDDIRQAIITAFKTDWGKHSLHYFQKLIPALGGDDLRDTLIEIARSDDGWPEFWPVGFLLEGWNKSDPVIASFLGEIETWNEKKLGNLAALLPKIITDAKACRARLLSLAQAEGARFDLISRGFATLGCTADDTEVVDLLMAHLSNGAFFAFDPGPELLTHFSCNASVRQYAVNALTDHSPPLVELALGFKDDPEIRSLILAFCNPLPATLRGDIADIASAEAATWPRLNSILADYDIEVDGELKITASIYYHRALARRKEPLNADHLAKLTRDLQAVGPVLHERRAAAFAGMLLLGRVADVVPMLEYGDKPLNVRTGQFYGKESDSLMALMAERWEELSEAFGVDFPERFGDFGSDEAHMWDCFAPHLSASAAVRRDFLDFVDRTDISLGLRSFLALAREQPSSDLLLRHCWRAFDREVAERGGQRSPWSIHRVQLEVAYILRDHFRDRIDVDAQLQEMLKGGQSAEVVALSLFDPTNSRLDQIEATPLEIGQHYNDWAAAIHLASLRSDPEEFVSVALAMINRPSHGIWDYQEVSNRAVIERLGRDAAAVELLKARLNESPTATEIASLPRLLSAAGAFDAEVTQRCTALLQQEAQEALPRAAYDAVDDSIRAVARCLLEVVTPPFSP